MRIYTMNGFTFHVDDGEGASGSTASQENGRQRRERFTRAIWPDASPVNQISDQAEVERLRTRVAYLESQISHQALLIARISRELDMAKRFPSHASFKDPKARETAGKIVEAGFRALALKNHPDVGGDQRAMIALNAAVDALRTMLGRI